MGAPGKPMKRKDLTHKQNAPPRRPRQRGVISSARSRTRQPCSLLTSNSRALVRDHVSALQQLTQGLIVPAPQLIGQSLQV
jgi:hypothetical protein